MQLDAQQIKQILDEVESEENKSRKRDSFASWQISEGGLRPYVLSKIQQMYPQTWTLYTIADYSLLKKVVDKKAKAYKESPVRSLSEDAASKDYSDIAQEYGLNQTMRNFDRMLNQHKYALIGSFMELNEGKPKFKFMSLAPHEFDCVKDSEGKLQAVILSYPDQTITGTHSSDGRDSLIAGNKSDEGVESKVYTVWTETNHYVVRARVSGKNVGSVEIMPIESNPDNLNPWGVLPFEYAPASDTPNYPVSSSLPGQTIELNALLSVYLTSGNMQVGQLVIKHPDGQQFNSAVQGMMVSLHLPQGDADSRPTEADYISPSPNMDGHRTSILTFLKLILDEQGISGAQAIEGQAQDFASGLDRMLSEADVQDAVELNQDTYGWVERQIYKIVRRQLQSANLGMNLPDEELKVLYRKPRMLISDTEKLGNLKLMMELGLLEEWEKFSVFDPNVSEDQAKEKIARIKAERSKALSEMALQLPSELNEGEENTENEEKNPNSFGK